MYITSKKILFYYSTDSSVEYTAQHKTFSLTVTTPLFTVSYTTEGRGLSSSVNKQDVTQATEIDLYRYIFIVRMECAVITSRVSYVRFLGEFVLFVLITK